MSLRPFDRLAAALGLVLLLASAPALGQDAAVGFDILAAQWARGLEQIERDARRGSLTAEQVTELKARIAAIRTEAEARIAATKAQMKPLEAQVQVLGPRPEEGAPAEAEDIANQRQRLESELAGLRAEMQKAQLILARARELDQSITARSQRELVDKLSTRLPTPLSPAVWAVAVPELAGKVAEILASPLDWWQGLPRDRRTEEILLWSLAMITLAIALGLVIRVTVRRWLGRDPAVAEPSYARRFTAAIAEAIATGIVPALIFGALLYRVRSEDTLVVGLFADVLSAFCKSMILIVLGWALPRAVLSPAAPSWRLLDLAPDNAYRICTLITALATVGAADVFFRESSGAPGGRAELIYSLELQSVYLLLLNVTVAILTLALMRPVLWHGGDLVARPEPEEQDDVGGAGSALGSAWLWRGAGRLASLLAMVAIGGSLIGYVYLGAYITWTVLDVGIVTGVLLLARGVLRELIGAALRSRFLQSTIGLSHATRSLLKFWFRLALDVVATGLWLLAILPLLGIPGPDVVRWTRQTLTGVTIGNITISVADIVIAVLAFLLALLVTRMVQRALEERILPHTRLDIGVRNSLKAGLGYVGVTIAAVIAISALGLDLSNLAIIAGALSVGIGFGLQTIVNNFVSGLILLIERPIKAGDWIVVAGHEGFVKRINVRATEIETFQRASVIIPNSELLSSALINWTHKDQYGRVEVAVGVAYGSDVEQVMKILRRCLDEHPKILRVPEPHVVFMGFGESSLDFEARGFIDAVVWRLFVASDIRVAIYRALEEDGIEIPFPQRDLHIKDVDKLREALSRDAVSSAVERSDGSGDRERPG